MTELASEKKTDWGMLGLAALAVWYVFKPNGNGNGNGNGIAQFRGLQVNYEGFANSPIEVYPDDAWGGTLKFEHKGAGKKVYLGIGFAVGSAVPYIHNNYFTYIPLGFTVPDNADWTPYEKSLTRLVGSLGGANYPNQKIDCHRFISNTMPPAGGVASDDYGLNDWDDDVYIVRELIGATTFRELSINYVGGEYSPPAAIYYGDVNGDGRIDSADAQLISQHITGATILTGDRFVRADLNGDGKVDVTDLQLINQFLAGIIDVFPVQNLTLALSYAYL